MAELNKEIVNEVMERASVLSDVPQVRMVAISLGYSFVELENDRMGICFTPRTAGRTCNHYNQAGSLRKLSLLELAGLMLSANPLEKSIGIAAANAVSQMIMDKEPEKYNVSETDFMKMLPAGPESRKVGMVGNIAPFIPMLLKRYSSLTIVDDNPSLSAGVQANGSVISKNLDDLRDSDVLIVTGSSAVVGQFDEAVNSAKSARFIGIVGPSAGWLPDPAFKKGVHAVAGTKITDIVGARHAILEGGGTPHFKKFGKKYTLVKPNTKPFCYAMRR